MSELLGSVQQTFQRDGITRRDSPSWAGASGPSARKSTDNDRQTWRGQNRQHIDLPHTPHFATSSTRYIDDNSNTSPRFPSPPSASFEGTNNVLNRPSGHVYWHASPSPSQQIRQRDFRKYLSSNTSPIQPLGTQAFRDELLRQGSAKKEVALQTRSNDSRKVKSPIVMDLCDQDTALKRRDSVDSSSLSSANTSSSRKFSRRISRRSMITSGESSLTSNATSGDGVHRLLADLNEHLKNQATSVLEPETYTSKESSLQNDLSGALDQNESLAKELDRIFSSQEEVQPDSAGLYRRKSREADIAEVKEVPIDASPSNARVWSRIKSSPAEMEASPRSIRKGLHMTKVNSTKDCFQSREKRQRLSTDIIPACEGIAEMKQQTVVAAPKGPARTSPRKRTALVEIKPVQTTTTYSKGKFVEEDCKVKEAKTRSSASPPKKWASTRTPRIGLSRHSTGSTQSHVTNQGIGNPAAPFKRPSKVDFKALKSIPKQQQCISQKKAGDPINLFDLHDEQSNKMGIGNAHSESKLAANDLVKTAEPIEEDTSFDMSMDEDLLCMALEKVEATQELQRISQLPKIDDGSKEDVIMSHNVADDIGDDSFEFNSSDNEAMISVMEAGGW